MISRPFKDIVVMAQGTFVGSAGNEVLIKGVSVDSRVIQPGNLFIPLIGDHNDGHTYVVETINKGAAAALWQTDRPNPPEGIPLIFVENTLSALQEIAGAYRLQLPVKVIGITGSNGKTTTKDLTASILSTTFKVHKTPGNMNTHIGLPLTILQLEEDTDIVVLEMGMRARGEIELLSEIARPDAVIITNVGEAHLLHLGSREEIARAKLEITKGMEEDGLFIYNGDEPLLEMELQAVPLPEHTMRFRFGKSPNNDYYPEEVVIDYSKGGTSFKINTVRSPIYFVPLYGLHNVLNAIAAIAVSKYMGVEDQEIVLGLKNTSITGMRVELMKGVSGLTVINDAYNASPSSVRTTIELLGELKGYEKKIAVLGDMRELGPQEQRYHQEIGRLFESIEVDYLFTYGPLSRDIALSAEPFMEEGTVKSFLDKHELLLHIASVAGPKDLVLVKGSRGLKLEELIKELINITV